MTEEPCERCGNIVENGQCLSCHKLQEHQYSPAFYAALEAVAWMGNAPTTERKQ